MRENPHKEELAAWLKKSDYQLKDFFNSRGQKYRQLELKDRLPSMTEDEQLAVLAGDGLLVKRPLLIGDNIVIIGFKEAEWQEKINI